MGGFVRCIGRDLLLLLLVLPQTEAPIRTIFIDVTTCSGSNIITAAYRYALVLIHTVLYIALCLHLLEEMYRVGLLSR